MKLTLTVIKGPHTGKFFEFDRHDTFIVGRAPNATFRLSKDDEFFSRNHFLIEVNPPQCRLLDLNSRNHTFVNDKLVTSIDLQDGDVIRGGKTSISVSFRVEEDHPQPDNRLHEHEITIVPRSRDGSKRALPIPSSPPSVPPSPDVTLKPQKELPVLSPAAPGRDEAKAPDVKPPVPSGELPQFPGYRTIRVIGQGGMGVVYEGDSLADKSRVAIKVISPKIAASTEDLSKFIREASILRDLRHPNIVRFRDLGQVNGASFIVMDYVEGINAGTLVKDRDECLPVPRAIGLTLQLLEALTYAHQRGYVHRDVKPANLLISTQNGVERLSLGDFGLARVYQSSKLSGLTMTGEIGGTTPFMPPEQITNYRKVDPAADQYSAAATLYYLLTKHYVYDLPRDVSKQLLMILQSDPVRIDVRRPDLSQKLVAVIHKALSRDPAARFPDVAAFHQALRSVSG